MAIPGYEAFMRPVLQHLLDGGVKSYRQLAMLIADEMGLNAEELNEMLPSGKQQTFLNRAGWAITYLKKAGLVDRPTRGMVAITQAGRDFFSSHSGPVSSLTLMQFEEFKQFVTAQPNDEAEPIPVTGIHETTRSRPYLDPADATPDEQLDDIVESLTASLRSDLLSELTKLSPTQFEHFVIKLMKGMGYGKAQGARATPLGGSGDGGVDGEIAEDLLGLDTVYLQAKRYTPTNKVGSPDILNFIGALNTKNATKGVFITTSAFTPAALATASTTTMKLALIDGEQLAGLMIEHGVGVMAVRKLVVKTLDEDFFESLHI